MSEDIIVADKNLKRWGQIAAFQKALIDQASIMIDGHHAKTLTDIHSGSILRSTAFIYRELFGEYVPELIRRHFGTDVDVKRLRVKIKTEKEAVIDIDNADLEAHLKCELGCSKKEVEADGNNNEFEDNKDNNVYIEYSFAEGVLEASIKEQVKTSLQGIYETIDEDTTVRLFDLENVVTILIPSSCKKKWL